MSKKAPRITALRYAILCILRDAASPMTIAHIYAAEPEGHNFHSTENLKQAIQPLFDGGLVERFDVGRGHSYAITEEGRAAIEGLADPGIDPGHTAEAADKPEDGEEDEEEIDFALWASGVLQIQIGDDNFAVPASKVPELKRYLDEQHRAIAQIERDQSFFKQLYDAKVNEIVSSIVSGVEKATRVENAPAGCPLPPIDPTLVAGRAAIADDPPPGASVKTSPHVGAVFVDIPKSLIPPNFAFERLGTPAPGTEAIGRPEVNLDGPNGIAGELSHGMTREQQFAETCARG